ncbi:MAG TPA: transcriptional regulator [bacterium]|nr:transcriptional regulator [bacterium]
MKLNLTEKDLDYIEKISNKTDNWLARDPTCYQILGIIKKEKEVYAKGIMEKYDIPDRTVGQAMERLKKHGYLTDRYTMMKGKDQKRRLRHFYSLKKQKKTFNPQ